MSEIREAAARLLLKAAYEMADDNEDSIADIFNCQHGFMDDLRRRAMELLEGSVGSMPDTPPDPDTMERLVKESGLSLDMLDARACEAYCTRYSTAFERYICAIGWSIDDMLGWEA